MKAVKEKINNNNKKNRINQTQSRDIIDEMQPIFFFHLFFLVNNVEAYAEFFIN